MADDNKRDTERVAVPAPLHGEVKVFQPMTILDISDGGAQIETPFALQLGSLHDFRISLGERSVVAKGRIAHCHIGTLKEGVAIYRTGVEFVEVSDHVASAIAHFVAALKLSSGARAILDAELADETS
jgi:PilZ domain